MVLQSQPPTTMLLTLQAQSSGQGMKHSPLILLHHMTMKLAACPVKYITMSISSHCHHSCKRGNPSCKVRNCKRQPVCATSPGGARPPPHP